MAQCEVGARSGHMVVGKHDTDKDKGYARPHDQSLPTGAEQTHNTQTDFLFCFFLFGLWHLIRPPPQRAKFGLCGHLLHFATLKHFLKVLSTHEQCNCP